MARFVNWRDMLSMKIGDEVHRVLDPDIDRRIGYTVNRCAIAIDIWDHRPDGMTRRPEVSKAGQRHHIQVWPKVGWRYDFDYLNDAVYQITEMSDQNISVAGLNYAAICMDIVEIPINTKADRERQKKQRLARIIAYESDRNEWVRKGCIGPEPPKPHEMKQRDPFARRIKIMEEAIKYNALPHADPHKEWHSSKRKR